MLKSKRKIIILALVAFFITLPLFTEARGLVPCGGYTDSGSREPACTVVDIFYLIARVTNWLIALSGVYAVFQIIGAGFWIVLAQGNEEKIAQKKEALLDAVIGMILVLMAFLFINTAVNGLLRSKCTVDLRDPLTYITIDQNYHDCRQPTK